MLPDFPTRVPLSFPSSCLPGAVSQREKVCFSQDLPGTRSLSYIPQPPLPHPRPLNPTHLFQLLPRPLNPTHPFQLLPCFPHPTQALLPVAPAFPRGHPPVLQTSHRHPGSCCHCPGGVRGPSRCSGHGQDCSQSSWNRAWGRPRESEGPH